MSNYNQELLEQIKNLKESASTIKALSGTMEALDTMATRHIEINNSFEKNLEHLHEYNDDFSELNISIKANINDLKAATLLFPTKLSEVSEKIDNTRTSIIELKESIISIPEKLSIISDKVKSNIEDSEKEIKDSISRNIEIIFKKVNGLTILLVLSLLSNMAVLGLLVYANFIVK